MAPPRSKQRALPPIDDFVSGVLGGDRATLARAITLVESGRADHRALAEDLLQRVLPKTGSAIRVGITGVPGVGKSTSTDQLGMNLIARGHKVAVLAIDPTSRRTGGAILGDKTRMERLSQQREAFIRPSPTAGTLGGVARRTRETMALVEAAGFDVVIVETVGVGQSETAVSDMVDFFLVLLLAGAGDELQGIKRGVLELADMMAVTKADGDNVPRATQAAADLKSALGILTPASQNWMPPVLTISARDNRGLEEMWDKIIEHRNVMIASGEFEARRQAQRVTWMRDMLTDRFTDLLRSDPAVAARVRQLEHDVATGRLTPPLAVAEVMRLVGLGSTPGAGAPD
ncbi:MAG: methylmalonyl Co-A mutase-associated GTPase MeaB [Hyphomicrobiaceae bacterium]